MSHSTVVRTWSPYQEAIFTALATGEGNIAVEAVAGAGKTSTIVEAFKRWQDAGNRGRAIFVCFNKSIATELASRVPAGVEARTLHSACFRVVTSAFRGIRVDDHKADDHAKVVIAAAGVERTDQWAAARELTKGYALLKATCADLSDVGSCEMLLNDYEFVSEFTPHWLPLLGQFDAIMRADQARCTFDEMLTFVLDHQLALPRYDVVAVDEAQDMSIVQIEILKKLVKATGRILVIGDSRQSLYRFRGADSGAMDRMRAEFEVQHELPLSITYRCPRAVVAAAQGIVAHLEASRHAPEGQVIRRTGAELPITLLALNPGDMVVCRCNAPLVGAAMALLRQGRRAMVKGRDIGISIIKLYKEVVRVSNPADILELIGNVQAYAQDRANKLVAARKEAQADALMDRADTLQVILETCSSFDDIESKCTSLFLDVDSKSAVVFSSAHKAKGHEAAIVVWLYPELNDYFLTKAKSDAARIQEENIQYVTITRAQECLIIQSQPKQKGGE